MSVFVWCCVRSRFWHSVSAFCSAVGTAVLFVFAAWLSNGVFCSTAGKPNKHALVGALGVGGLASSRDGAAFGAGAAHMLRGARLALVLNSLSADFISASAALLREGGGFAALAQLSSAFIFVFVSIYV